jgi:hypothetical protein
MGRKNKKLAPPSAWPKGASSLVSPVEIRAVLVMLCISVFAGCATDTNTGTKKPMNIGALSKIDNLEVQVRADKGFSVDVAGQEVNAIDFLLLPVALLGGIGGQAVAGAVDQNVSQPIKGREDAQRAKKLRETIADINLQSLAQKALVDGLETSHRFKSVTAATERAEPSASGAAILRVRIENWGLFSDRGEDRSLQKVQAGINATAVLVGADGQTIWQRNDYITSGAQHSFNEYGSSPELLKTDFTEIVKRYSARMANEIRYAR